MPFFTYIARCPLGRPNIRGKFYLTGAYLQPPAIVGLVHPFQRKHRFHEHDGFRLMALRDAAGLTTSPRASPLIVAAVTALPARSCLLDGEAIVSDEAGLAVFELIRRQCVEIIRGPRQPR